MAVMPVAVVMTVVIMAAVMFMMMPMVMLIMVIMIVPVFMAMAAVTDINTCLFLAVHRDPNVGTHDPAFHRWFGSHQHAWDSQRVEPPQEVFRIRMQFQKSSHQHVAGGPHVAIQVDCSHLDPSTWLIMLARYPAPNPLSMFTTLTPLAQELSMERRAESPPNDAP